jgi:UDP-glucuronate 4-epimerase
MNYLVTGAAGFIGSHLCATLKTQGHEVTAIDNFSDYYSPELKKARVRNLLTPIGISVQDIDLARQEAVAPIFSESKYDFVVHLAAQPGVRTPMDQSWKYVRDNLIAFTNVLQNVVQARIPNFLYASSSSVYGNLQADKFSEFDLGLSPISVYGATKLSNELLASAYTRNSETKSRGMRFFTVYGPWGRPDMAYFRLISAAMNDECFELFGDGGVKRDFTYVGDITSKLVDLSSELDKRSPGYSDVVNIGGGSPYSMQDLISIVNSEFGSDVRLVEQAHNISDTKFTCSDTTLLNSLTPEYEFMNLQSGVRETLKWAKTPGVSECLASWVRSSI